MCHKLNSKGPALRILGLGVASPMSQGPISGVLGVRAPVLGSWVSGSHVSGSQSPRSQCPGSRVSRSRVSGSQGPGSQSLRDLGPRSQVLIFDYAVFNGCSLVKK